MPALQVHQCIVPEGIPFGRAESRVELFFGHNGRVCLEFIKIRYVAGYPDVQVAPVHELGGIGDDAAQILVVQLITPKLRLAEIGSGDEDRLQADTVFQDEHVGIELQLPSAVHHLLGDNHLEAKIHASVPFGYIAEAGRDYRRIDDFAGHHLAGGLILDGFHQDEFVLSLGIHYLDGVVIAGADDFPLFGQFAPGKGQTGGHLPVLHCLKLAGSRTGEQQKQDEKTLFPHGQKMN